MESIKEHLNGWKEKVGFKERYEEVKQKIISDPLVKKIMVEFDLNEMSINPYLTQIENVRTSYINCKRCAGLESCANQIKGHKVYMEKHNGSPVFINKPCEFKKEEIERKKQQSLIKSYFITEELRDITINDIEVEENEKRRAQIKLFLAQYAKDVVPGKDGIGIYLYGYFGNGKTYMMWALINYLSKVRGISSIIVYVPDFVRELKSSINNRDISVEDKINAMKEVPVLVLDDIGSETLTPWIRDEVIGAILQHRVNAKLVTLYTSNKSLEDLKEHFSYTSTNGKENQKAERIMERIENYSNVLHSLDRNRRKEKNAHLLTRLE